MDTHNTTTAFSELNLLPPLLKAVQQAGFSHCTPVQSKTLPLLLQQKDVAGQAPTGTGKTAAYLLASLQLLLQQTENPSVPRLQPLVAIIAPTRELAIQIYRDAITLAAYMDVRIALIYGGVGYDKQLQTLSTGVDLLIGTPGRMIDYLKQKTFHFKQIQAVVLDEADRMFDLGFIRDIRYLLRRMPPPAQRLNMLFSATLSHRVMELAYEHMGNPVMVRTDSERITAEKITESLYHVSKEEKVALLLGLLKKTQIYRCIVFVNTRRKTEYLTSRLQNQGIKAAHISGDIPQLQRQRALRHFTEGEVSVLVTTDVASRGLHISDVSHVFNFDLPQNSEDYVHRIGRTARAGASGNAISFACEEYVFSLTEIEKYIGHKIPVKPVHDELLHS